MAFFQKIELSTTSQVLQKWSYNLQNNSPKTLKTPIYYFLWFVVLDNTKKNGLSNPFSGRIAFSPKITVFNTLLGAKEMIL